jgi:hypothetical protein
MASSINNTNMFGNHAICGSPRGLDLISLGGISHIHVNTSVCDCTACLLSLPHSFPEFPNLALNFPQTTSCIDSI